MYLKNDVLNRMAIDIMESIKKLIKNLNYDKTYMATITAKSGNVYTVQIHGDEYQIKCNYNFPIGKTIDVLAKQNNKSNLSFIVSYDDLVK